MAIQDNEISFLSLKYTISALPKYAATKLEGFAQNGVKWDDIDIGVVKMGADGLPAFSKKAAIHTVTFTFLANSTGREIFDKIAELTEPKAGTLGLSIPITMTVTNETTGTKRVYGNGRLMRLSGGDSAQLDGQEDKSYRLSFTRV